jgi:hypothetical protein
VPVRLFEIPLEEGRSRELIRTSGAQRRGVSVHAAQAGPSVSRSNGLLTSILDFSHDMRAELRRLDSVEGGPLSAPVWLSASAE